MTATITLTEPYKGAGLARFYHLAGVAFDSGGNLFVADQANHCIRKVTAAGVVTTFVGTTGTSSGHTDDTGTAARFNYPMGLAFDTSGNLFVADSENHCIRKITTAASVTTFVGTDTTFSGHLDPPPPIPVLVLEVA